MQAKRGVPIPEDSGIDMNAIARALEQINQRLTNLEERQGETRPAQGRRDQRRRGRRDRDSDGDTNPFHEEDSSEEDEDLYQQRNRRQDYHVKVDIPEFDGRAQGDAFVDWLYTVERIFEYEDFSELKKVKLIAIKLKGYASLWWENVKRERQREGRRPIATWEKMKKELKKRFLPDNYKQDNFLKVQNLKQLETSVESYTREFEYLMLKCNLVEPEEQTIARYLGGLKKEIVDVIKLQSY